MRHRDDFVARTDAERSQRQNQRIGSATDADRMRDAAIFRERALEGFDLVAEDIGAAFEDARDRGLDLHFRAHDIAPAARPRDHGSKRSRIDFHFRNVDDPSPAGGNECLFLLADLGGVVPGEQQRIIGIFAVKSS